MPTSETAAGVPAEKERLRRAMKALRAAYWADAAARRNENDAQGPAAADGESLARAAAALRAAADARICASVCSLPRFAAAETVFLYNAFGSEAGTSAIAARAKAEGKAVFYPRVRGREMELVRDEGQAFARGPFGIMEPAGPVEHVLPQFCVLPLLAADARFHRLGYGGGYYDRALAAWGDAAFKAGIGYDFQLLGTVPAEAHDVLTDALVTDARVLVRR